MKKYRWILIVLLICVSLLGCSQTDGNEQQTSVASSTPAAAIGGAEIAGGWRFISSLSEYEAFFADRAVPSSFVTYEELRYLGEFIEFYYAEAPGYDDMEVWCYTLQDEAGFVFTLQYDKLFTEFTAETTPVTKAEVLSAGGFNQLGKGEYIFDNIKYSCGDRGLYHISWLVDGKEFEVFGDSGRITGSLYKYPAGQNTFIAKLMDPETARQTVDSFLESIAD